MGNILEINSRPYSEPGPDPMSEAELKAFFDFYKTNTGRALLGFFKDLRKSKTNILILSEYLEKKENVRCLLVGCSHWANPKYWQIS